MECQECHQRPASFHFTQIVHGNKTEVSVCEECAQEKGYMAYPTEESHSLHNLLAGLLSFDSTQMGNHSDHMFKQRKDTQCPACKLTFSEFQRVGKFGCATCYQTFSSRLNSIIRRVQSGNTIHYGKIPKRQGGSLHIKKQIKSYQLQLKQLIDSELFEEAAFIRDRIKELKNHQSELGDH